MSNSNVIDTYSKARRRFITNEYVNLYDNYRKWDSWNFKRGFTSHIPMNFLIILIFLYIEHIKNIRKSWRTKRQADKIKQLDIIFKEN